MSSDSRLLVRIKGQETAGLLQAAVGAPPLTDGAWLVLEDSQDRGETTAQELSQRLATTTIWWTIHTVVDQIWLLCFEQGQVVRELRYSAEEGWATRSGAPLAFEGPGLKKWLRKKDLSASSDGYDILDCFIGKEPPPGPSHQGTEGQVDRLLARPAGQGSEGARQTTRGPAVRGVAGDLGAWKSRPLEARAQSHGTGHQRRGLACDVVPLPGGTGVRRSPRRAQALAIEQRQGRVSPRMAPELIRGITIDGDGARCQRLVAAAGDVLAGPPATRPRGGFTLALDPVTGARIRRSERRRSAAGAR